jgi:VWFA-related protein
MTITHRRTSVSRLGASLLIALSVATLPAQQQPAQPRTAQPTGKEPPQATFRASTRLVVHTVSVKDKDGKPIAGLTPKDFVVTENNESQEVAFAVYQQLDGELAEPLPPVPGSAVTVAATPAAVPAAAAPAAVTPATAIPPGTAVPPAQVFTPAPGDIKYQNRRLMVFYFDPGSMSPPEQTRAYSSALKYVDTQMKPADVISIMTFQNGAVRVKQEFTDNKDKLKEAIALMIYGDDVNGDGIPDSPDGGTPFGQDDSEFNLFNTDRRLAALQTAVTSLRALPEQKVLLYFASGLRLTGTDNQAQLTATTNAAIRANVTINPIDTRGLVAMAPLGDASRASPGGGAIFSGQMAMSMMMGFQQSQDTLYSLAKDTGGKALLDYNDLSVGIVQAASAVTSYYVIGYYSTHINTDGRFRRIKITLADNSQAQLAFRPGYYGDKAFANFSGADKERQLEDALMLENPITDVTIAMEVNFFQLNKAEYFVPVAVKIPGSELAIVRRRGSPRTEIDFIGIVKDEFGNTVQNIRDRLKIELTDDAASQLANRPIQYDTGFTLLPGKYVLKVLTRDGETGRIGTFQGNFTIPNLNREEKRLPISSVVLSSQRVPLTDALYSVQQKVDATLVNPLVHDGQKLFPSVTRVFSVARDMYIYLQAYERLATTTQPLVAYVSFYQGDVKTFETAPIPVVDGLNEKSKAVPIRISVPLQSLRPGRYDCQVTILEPSSQKIAFWRAPVVMVP